MRDTSNRLHPFEQRTMMTLPPHPSPKSDKQSLLSYESPCMPWHYYFAETSNSSLRPSGDCTRDACVWRAYSRWARRRQVYTTDRHGSMVRLQLCDEQSIQYSEYNTNYYVARRSPAFPRTCMYDVRPNTLQCAQYSHKIAEPQQLLFDSGIGFGQCRYVLQIWTRARKQACGHPRSCGSVYIKSLAGFTIPQLN